MKKWLKYLLLTITVVMLLLIAFYFWLTRSEAGSRWLLGFVESEQKPLIKFENIKGSINKGIFIKKIRFNDNGTDVLVQNLNTQFSYHLFPLTVDIERLSIAEIETFIGPGEAVVTEDVETDLSLPLVVNLESLDIAKLYYRDTGTQITADNTHLVMQMADQLNLKEFSTQLAYQASTDNPALTADQTQSLGAQLKLSGQSELKAPWKHQFEVQIIPSIDAANPDQYLQLINADIISLSSKGNAQQTLLTLETSGNTNLTLSAQLQDLLDQLQWQAELVTESLILPLTQENENVELQQLKFSSSGDLQNWQLDGGSQLRFNNGQSDNITGQWQLKAQLRQNIIEISQLTLDGDIGQFDFQGEIDAEEFWINGELDWQQLKAAAFSTAWPAQITSSGHTRLSYADKKLSITDLLATVDETSTRIEGDIDLIDNTIDARLSWKNLDWPPGNQASEHKDFHSSTGNLSINGTLEDYLISGHFNLVGKSIPAGVYQLEGNGNQTALHLSRLDSQILEGGISIGGDISWEPVLLANLAISSTAINPGVFWSDYPGNLDLNMDMNWRSTAIPAEEQLTLQLHQLSGKLRNYPISAKGKIQLLGGNDLSLDIETHSGDAMLKLNSQSALNEPLAGSGMFNFEIPDLGQILSAAKGQISAQGQLEQISSGSRLLLQVQAESIDAVGLSVETLLMDVDTIFAESSKQGLQLTGQLSATNLTSTDLSFPIDSIAMVATQTEDYSQPQMLSITVEADDHSVSALLNGSINLNQQDPSIDAVLESLELTTPITGKLALQQAAQLEYSKMQFMLGTACFRQQPDDVDAEICLSRQTASQQKQTATELKLGNIPLAWVAAYLPADITMSQTLSGEISLYGERAITSINSIEGNLTTTSGLITSNDLEAGSLETNQGLLTFNMDSNEKINGVLDLPFKVGTGLKLDFSIDHAKTPEKANINSQVDIILDDLIALKWLVPGLDDLSGTFESHLQVQGDLTNPKIEGTIDVNNVGLDYTPLGLNISQLNLKGSLVSDTYSSIQGGFFAGDGEGQINIGIDNTKPQSIFDISVSGTELQLLNAPGLKLKASPNLKVQINGNRLALEGKIEIPGAHITPAPGMLTTTPVSEDVVVTGLELNEQEQEKELPMEISGTLKVALGDDVYFLMDGLKAHLSGGMDLLFDGTAASPLATGSIQLNDGYFEQYGQNLQFEHSEIQFDGKSVSNPKLDIYAVRHIFADPETDQESAVAYIATGSNFDHGNGVGALNLGTYIYPKLFVSYGIGLFDSGNVVSARYELTPNWAVQGVSGEADSGVDILYSIDR